MRPKARLRGGRPIHGQKDRQGSRGGGLGCVGFVLLAAELLLVVSLYLVSEHVKNKALYEQLGVLRGSLLNVAA